jgi:hypothetical protein
MKTGKSGKLKLLSSVSFRKKKELKKSCSFFDILPVEILAVIFSHLNPQERRYCRLVCSVDSDHYPIS